MIDKFDIVSPCIYVYDDFLDSSLSIIKTIDSDKDRWILNNKDAEEWQQGEKILGYDEYPIEFNLSVEKSILLLGKQFFDYIAHYCKNNLLEINNFESCVARKYSIKPSFLQLESPEEENPLRKISSMLFLNDCEHGGNINFKNFDLSIYPKAGRLIVFPSSFAYCFKIERPKDEENFIIISHFV